MTIRRAISSIVSLVLVGSVLILAFPNLFGNRVAAAPKPTHFQIGSNDVGGRFLAGPFPANTQLAITSLTVAAPGQPASTQFGIRVAHGAGASIGH